MARPTDDDGPPSALRSMGLPLDVVDRIMRLRFEAARMLVRCARGCCRLAARLQAPACVDKAAVQRPRKNEKEIGNNRD